MNDLWSKTLQKIKSKVANESLPTISQETTESVTINDKTNRNTYSTNNTAAPTPAQEEVT